MIIHIFPFASVKVLPLLSDSLSVIRDFFHVNTQNNAADCYLKILNAFLYSVLEVLFTVYNARTSASLKGCFLQNVGSLG